MNTNDLAPGLLLAAPALGDPNFKRTVVLLGHHDGEGALGWVLNGKSLVPVRKLLEDADLIPPGVTLPDTPSFDAVVRVGGPVMPGSAWVLFRQPQGHAAYHGEHDLGGGYAITGARELIEAIARGEGPTSFRVFLGYAGWGSSQLEGEIAAGAWLPAKVDPALLVDGDADTLWDEAYRLSVGTSPLAFTTRYRGQA